ncbi:MAG: hypothetical protein Q605_AUC00938G0002 [Actinomyces urogenitalis DORA_12]|uniref:Uncharacterized protein n=1 Tax=Actinomyces urogenitalis DORA_12 TaxID=1403939 RepID=W1VDB4_9ACTO|nr:MAG: hypothetical protein Q605_AUC00938G0002 [Actinomyces urogenitalis DORA_12]
MPQLGAAQDDVQAQGQGDQSHGGLGEDEELALVNPVREQTGMSGEEQRR